MREGGCLNEVGDDLQKRENGGKIRWRRVRRYCHPRRSQQTNKQPFFEMNSRKTVKFQLKGTCFN